MVKHKGTPRQAQPVCDEIPCRMQQNDYVALNTDTQLSNAEASTKQK